MAVINSYLFIDKSSVISKTIIKRLNGEKTMLLYKKKTIGLAILSSIISVQAYSADRVDLGQPGYLQKYNIDIQSLLSNSGDPYTTYTVPQRRPIKKPKKPIKHVQEFLGVEVYDVSVVATINTDNNYYDISGQHIANIQTDLSSVAPTISVKEALAKALQQAPETIQQSNIYNIESKLYIWLDKNNTAHLAWFISYVDTTSNPSRPHLFIDAHTGVVLDSWEGMTFADGTGPGGNERTGRYQFGSSGKFPAFQVTGSGSSCRLDSTNVITYDMNHQTSGGSVHTFPCYENTARQVNGSYSALNDAHAFGQVTFSMFKDWYNQAPLTQKLKMRVHYDRDYENAFWDGQQMTFGDGKNTFHPLVGLGVVAHEVSHGFTQQNSNLRYENQSGGLNESFSDISAAAASYYLEGRFSWQIGDKIKKNSGAMRYMDSPTRDGRSIDHTRNYTNGMNVHFSSGVFNKAFYLLSTTADWNIHKAFDIYVSANQTYWTANETFNGAGQGVYKAAKALGYCVDDVLASLEAVGVTNSGSKDGSGCGPTGNTGPTANFTVSTNELTASFSDASTDDKGVVSYAWNFGDGANSSSQNPTHSYTADGSYTVNLTVSDAEGESDVKSTSVTVSKDGGNTGCDGVTAWSVSTSYVLGDEVSYNNYKYEAIWWSTGAKPDVFSNVWSKKAECSGGGGVNQAPTAQFSHSANELVVSFTDSSTDDNAVSSHSWSFGDGSSSNTANPMHTYANDGSYSVQLTVADAEGLTDSSVTVLTVAKGGGSTCSAPAWSANDVYTNGDKVSQDGKEYQANWWTQDESPSSNSGQWQVWTLVADCQG